MVEQLGGGDRQCSAGSPLAGKPAGVALREIQRRSNEVRKENHFASRPLVCISFLPFLAKNRVKEKGNEGFSFRPVGGQRGAGPGSR